jgi:hypothetical protein
MINFSLPPTTHTLEMAQVAELNGRLSHPDGSPPITADALGMGGAALHSSPAGSLPGTAVLVRLSWQGSPEFPDIYGHFGGASGDLYEALLHTAALHQLGHHLHVRQRWGIGPPEEDHRNG